MLWLFVHCTNTLTYLLTSIYKHRCINLNIFQVRHAALMDKVGQHTVPDEIYNWISDFLEWHSHCTRLSGKISSLTQVTASIIQGSGLGPAADIVTATDLRPLSTSNAIVKFTDDTYLIVPAVSSYSCVEEVSYIEACTAANNLRQKKLDGFNYYLTGLERQLNIVTCLPRIACTCRISSDITASVRQISFNITIVYIYSLVFTTMYSSMLP